jgi:hypothetical protein
MADFLGKDWDNATIEIDDNRFTQCSFNGCKLIYRGGGIPLFEGCKLDFCTWHWDDGALRTIEFLRGIHSGLGADGQRIVDSVLKHVYTPFGAN